MYNNTARKPRNSLSCAMLYSKYLLFFVMAACHNLPTMRPACFSAWLYILGCLSAFGQSVCLPDTCYLVVCMLSIRMRICLHACLFASLPAQQLLSSYLPVCMLHAHLLPLCLPACLLNCPVCYHLGYELLVDQVEDGCLHLPVPACSLCACLLNCVILAACFSA